MNSSKTTMRAAFFVGALSATLMGCPPTPPANGDSGVDAGDCSGTIGCACVNGACTTGECVGGTCTDCRRGEAACICRSNDTCNTGLRCNAGRCVTCPAGELNCACGNGDTCGTGLVCASGVCVANTCVDGTESCPCRAGDPKCDGTAYCNGTNICTACTDDQVGCPCNSGGMCTGQAVCDATSMKCRAQKSCADLVAANMCGANQVCTPATNGADAVCVSGQCVTGYKWNGSACVQCVSSDCSMEPACSTDGGADFCSVINKVCIQQGLSASCGACLQGFTADATGNCVAAPTCGDAGTCGLNQYCDRTVFQCLDLPCDAGMAKNPTTGTCSSCPPCSGEGTSGRVWPFRYQGRCICETLDNYYWPPGTENVAIKCDADNDGWVVESADTTEIQQNDPLAQNARCRIQKVDRVRLMDEYGVFIDVLSCAADTKKAAMLLPDGGAQPGTQVVMLPDAGLILDAGVSCVFSPIRLLETARNDGAAGSITSPPRYPENNTNPGRGITPGEVNSISKACTAVVADYNDNGVDDIEEIQGRPGTVTWPADRTRLHEFSYFMELATSYTVGNVLVIAERSRCNLDFPLHYDPSVAVGSTADRYDAGVPQTYWRNCTRSRDPSYDSTMPQPGYDFAKWECPGDPSGPCFLGNNRQAKMPHPTLANADPSTDLMRGHGLCELKGTPPADRVWRGMSHHSQFKCVNVSSATDKPYNRVTTAFGAGALPDGGLPNLLTLNQCRARDCDAGVCTMPQGDAGTPQTRLPVIDCTAQAGAVNAQVGFAAVNFRPYKQTATLGGYGNTSYQGGCINEDDDQHSAYLCPSPEFSLVKDDAVRAFGRYSCYGKESNFLWCCDGNNAPTRSTLYWAPAPGRGIYFR